MKASEIEKQYYGEEVTITTKDKWSCVYKIANETGDIILTRYEVFPGVALIYNDVHAEHVEVQETNRINHIFEINHCREGRIEFETASGELLYIKKGDMATNTKAGVKNSSFFPISHYHGVTIEIDFGHIEREFPEVMKMMQIDLEVIKEKFYKKDKCYIFRENAQFEHLFAELYCVPDSIKAKYYKIKVIEILLLMSVLDVSKEKVENQYYNKSQVVKVKQIRNYLVSHLDSKMTVEQLANQFGVSQTYLKKTFKVIYGMTPYAYIKEYRMRRAAEMLRQTDDEILTIAGKVGYDNASKFSKRFKEIIGISPSEYRKCV